MLWGVVLEPGALKVVKVWPSAASDEDPNATPRMEMVKHRESFRRECLTRGKRNGVATAGIRDVVIG
jgi:hypothetical protein